MAFSNAKMARDELLIVLDYLIKNTDETHHTTQKDVVDFALSEYGVAMRRQRVTEILQYLMDVTSRFPNSFPFIMEENDNEQRKKYYIAQRQLSEMQLYEIARALINSRYTSKEDARELVRVLVTYNTRANKVDDVVKELFNQRFNVAKVDKMVSRTIIQLEKAIREKKLVTLKIKDQWSLIYDGKFVKDRIDIKGEVSVYVYAIRDFEGRAYAICGDGKRDVLVSIPLDECSVVGSMAMGRDAPSIKRLLQSFKYESIDEYLEAVVIPGGGRVEEIVFQFHNNGDDTILNKIKRSFESHFKIVMDYKRTPIKLKIAPYNRSTNTFDHNHLVDFEAPVVIVKTKMDNKSFLDWVVNSHHLGKIHILEPYSLLHDLTRRLEMWAHNYRKFESNFNSSDKEKGFIHPIIAQS